MTSRITMITGAVGTFMIGTLEIGTIITTAGVSGAVTIAGEIITAISAPPR